MKLAKFSLNCPKCGNTKKANWMIGTKNHSNRMLDLLYFMCGDCRTIHISRELLRSVVSGSRKGCRNQLDLPSYAQLCTEAIVVVSKTVEVYCRTESYTCRKFTKTIEQTLL